MSRASSSRSLFTRNGNFSFLWQSLEVIRRFSRDAWYTDSSPLLVVCIFRPKEFNEILFLLADSHFEKVPEHKCVSQKTDDVPTYDLGAESPPEEAKVAGMS